jgi:UDP-glucose:glycoprotein glucosyltransferase
LVQQSLIEEKINNNVYLPELFLNDSSLRRNPLVIPENDKDVTLVNLPNVLGDYLETTKLPRIRRPSESKMENSAQLIVIGDFNSVDGIKLAASAARFRSSNFDTEIIFIHNPSKDITLQRASKMLDIYYNTKSVQENPNIFATNLAELAEDVGELKSPPKTSWPDATEVLENLRLTPGENAVLLNGRIIGPISTDTDFSPEDFDMLYSHELKRRNEAATEAILDMELQSKVKSVSDYAKLRSLLAISQVSDIPEGIFEAPPLIRTNLFYSWDDQYTSFSVGDNSTAVIQLVATLDPASEIAQRWAPLLQTLSELEGVFLKVFLNPRMMLEELPVKRFYRYVIQSDPTFNEDGSIRGGAAEFSGIPAKALLTMGMDMPAAWVVTSKQSVHDLDNIKLSSLGANERIEATYELEYILIEGHSRDVTTSGPPAGTQLVLSAGKNSRVGDTIIMANLGYFQFKANPGHYNIDLKEGPSQEIFKIDSVGALGYEAQPGDESTDVTLLSFQGVTLYPRLSRKPGKEEENVLEVQAPKAPDLVKQGANIVGNLLQKAGFKKDEKPDAPKHADINIFSVASGHLYERMLNIMMVSVTRHTNHTVKFWFIEQFLSPSFKEFVPTMAQEYGFQYEMVTYKWPHWLRAQKEKQREIWGYKILFLDVLFPLDLDKVIFVDADQIVRTDMMELNNVDLEGAPYGFTPMCDSRTEMEGFRFWKQGYWKNFLRGLPYHISALYVVDLKRFRQLAAGDRLRGQYHQLSADPNSLSNLDQDLPNNMQMLIPIHSLDQNWLWCETWCSDESLKDAKTIDLCNNPQTKEPKLERARRQVPEWTEYDDEIAALAKRSKQGVSIPLGKVQEDELAEKDGVKAEDPHKLDKKKKPREKDEL